jgi:transposase
MTSSHGVPDSKRVAWKRGKRPIDRVWRIVVEHVRRKHACPACAANLVIAPRLHEPIEKGLPGTGLLAHVITSKLADQLPLYRLEGILGRQRVDLARSTICGNR